MFWRGHRTHGFYTQSILELTQLEATRLNMLAEALPAAVKTIRQGGLSLIPYTANGPILSAGNFRFLADERGSFTVPQNLTIACPAVATPHTASVLHMDLTALDIIVELAARPSMMGTHISVGLL